MTYFGALFFLDSFKQNPPPLPGGVYFLANGAKIAIISGYNTHINPLLALRMSKRNPPPPGERGGFNSDMHIYLFLIPPGGYPFSGGNEEISKAII